MCVPEIVVNIPRPHAGQARIDREGKRHTMLRCGRRYGKTKFGIYRALKCALAGEKVGWFAPTNKYALEAWRECVSRLREYIKATGGRISDAEKRIETAEGGLIEVWSLADNDDPARGREYDLVIFDEAGLVPRLADIFEAAVEPTLATTGGKSLFLGTPKGARTSFNMMFADAERGVDEEWSAFNGKTVENTTRPKLIAEVEKARKRAERRGTLAIWRQEYEGVPADDGSNPIGMVAIERCSEPATRDESLAWSRWFPVLADGAKARRTVCFGVDLARSTDYTVVVGFDVFGRWSECHRWQADWGTTKKRLLSLIGTELPTFMDASGVGSPIVQDLQLVGMQVTPYVFTYRSRGTLIEDLVTAFHGQRLLIPDNFIRQELESLSVVTNEETGFTRYQVPNGMHDDGMMALALAWRCYGYAADAPDMRDETLDRPWHAGRDATTWTTEDAEDEFGSLGAGW